MPKPSPTFLTLPPELRQQIFLDSYTPHLNADWNRSIWEGALKPGNIKVKGWTKVLMSAFPTLGEDVSYVGDIACRKLFDEYAATRTARAHLLPDYRKISNFGMSVL